MWTFVTIFIWLIAKDQSFAVANPVVKELSVDFMARHARAIVSANLTGNPIHNDPLTEQWQDWILAQMISVNYLNILMVLTSKGDFAFTVPPNYSIRYVQNTASFFQTISQLATQMQNASKGAREDLSSVYTGMEHVPEHLQKMSILIKQAPFDLLVTLFPDYFNKIEKLVNASLLVLRRPAKNFEQMLNLLTEIDDLLRIGLNDQMISLQVHDLKAQWSLLTTLILELAARAEAIRDYFLLQFSWILQEFIRSGPSFPDALRDFIISLLLPKMVEIDRAADLLGMITKMYSDISFQFTDELIGGNGNLLLLEEQDRPRYLNRYRHDLPSQVVQIARLALKQHKDFLERDQNRQTKYEAYFAKTSKADLAKLTR